MYRTSTPTGSILWLLPLIAQHSGPACKESSGQQCKQHDVVGTIAGNVSSSLYPIKLVEHGNIAAQSYKLAGFILHTQPMLLTTC